MLTESTGYFFKNVRTGVLHDEGCGAYLTTKPDNIERWKAGDNHRGLTACRGCLPGGIPRPRPKVKHPRCHLCSGGGHGDWTDVLTLAVHLQQKHQYTRALSFASAERRYREANVSAPAFFKPQVSKPKPPKLVGARRVSPQPQIVTRVRAPREDEVL